MRKLIKKSVIKIFGPAIQRLGYRLPSPVRDSGVNETDKNFLLGTLFTILRSLNFVPKHIVDVGANHGTWTREVLKYFPDATYTLLEPQYWLKDSIKDLLEQNRNIRFYPVGSGEEEGSFKFTIVDRDDSCTFRYSEEDAKRKGFRQIDVQIRPLNELLLKEKLSSPDIIKIDAEGLDIKVLKGADNYFGKTEVFMVESAVNNKSFCNDVIRTINFMDENGYRLFDITDINRPWNVRLLWLVELVFIKKGGFIDRAVFTLYNQ